MQFQNDVEEPTKMNKGTLTEKKQFYCYITVNIANTFEDVKSQEQMLMYVYNSTEDDYEDELD